MASTINAMTTLGRRLAACLALTLAVLGGCVSYQANRADIVDHIQALLDDREYGQALATIDLVKPDHHDYARIRAWRTVIEKNASKWQAELIDETEALVEFGQWYNAGQLFEEGAAKLPPSDAFDRARRSFEIRRAAHLHGIELQLALARGRGLPTEIDALERIYAMDPGDDAMRRSLETKQQQLVDARIRLVACGREALDAGNTERATLCLRVAQGIVRTNDVERLLAMARRDEVAEINKQRIASEKREQRDQVRRFEHLVIAYEKTLRSGNLHAAREQLNQLIIMQPRNSDLHRQRAAVNSRIELRVAQSLQDGRELYTQGNFEGAHAVWVAGLHFDPNNEELKTSIARAERVLDKLRQLSDQQSTTN